MQKKQRLHPAVKLHQEAYPEFINAKTEEYSQYFPMAINRRLAPYVIVFVFLAAVGTLMLIATWIGSLTVGITRGADLNISDVQFEKDYLNITVENICDQAKVVSEVTISYQGSVIENQPATRRTIPLYESISVGEQISIRVSFKWTSGRTYEIRLETADTTDWSHAGMYTTQAP